ncbi:MAG TPA: DUF2975 domain-containing protein [Patescibacteria group bacterium]|nr:DUF2975 domain-containing protein [Patescibacteria group bacterium]
MKAVGPRSMAALLNGLFYLALALGVLAFLYRLGSFGIAMKHADNLGKFTSTSLYQLPTQDLARAEWRSQNGRVRLSLHRLYGELRHRNLPRAIIVYIFAGQLVLFFCFFVAVIQLINICEDLSAGKIFEPDSARRLRLVGLAVTGAALFNPLWEILPLWLFRPDITVPGTRLPWFFILWETLNFGLLLGGLLLLVVAEAFRIGHLLQEEQQLTV